MTNSRKYDDIVEILKEAMVHIDSLFSYKESSILLDYLSSGKTFGEIAPNHELSSEMVRTIYLKALKKLKKFCSGLKVNSELLKEVEALKIEIRKLTFQIEEVNMKNKEFNEGDSNVLPDFLPKGYELLMKDLDLSQPIKNKLMRSGYTTLGDLLKEKDPKEFLKIRSFGRKQLYELLEFVQKKGYEWGESKKNNKE